MAITGPLVLAAQIDRLLQPFQQHLATDRIVEHEGLGLGLSIVAAIATAHGATLDVHPGDAGGLDIDVIFLRSAVDDSGLDASRAAGRACAIGELILQGG